MNCNEHHIICKAVGDGWICTACETRYMPMSEHEARVAEEIAKLIEAGDAMRTAICELNDVRYVYGDEQGDELLAAVNAWDAAKSA